MNNEDLARHIPADRPRLKHLVLAESIEPRRLQMAYALADLFRVGPNPGTGAEAGLTEEEFLDSLEALMDLQNIEWDTPLPIVRIPRGNRI
jgi:hypothetical protein